MTRIGAATILIAFAIGLPTLVVFAGDLTPPAGPVGDTMKSLDQVEPRIPLSASTAPGDAGRVFWITQPGSYYLMGNLDASSSGVGIQISVSDVTLDLNGFTIIGGPSASTGIYVGGSGTLHNITVHNGALRSFPNSGVALANATDCRISNLTVTDCGNDGNLPSIGYGISAVGTLITHCVVSGNRADGIHASQDCAIIECIANRNGGIGITIDGGLVSGVVAKGNANNLFATGGTLVVNTLAP